MKKLLKRVLVVVLAVVLVLVAAVAALVLHSRSYTVPPQAERIENDTGLVQASGRSLYDARGERLQLKGINAGQLLLQEGWMSPFALEPLKNGDGTYVKDADGNIQYPEFSQEQMLAGLAENPNLAGYEPEQLLEYYYSCFFQKEDFRIIREELGLNTIRLPFYYRNILTAELTRLKEDTAFAYLDWFIGQAAEQGLYIVLDLHGAPGS